MSIAQDSLMLAGVGLLNIFAAIILAAVRARSENVTRSARVPDELEVAQG